VGVCGPCPAAVKDFEVSEKIRCKLSAAKQRCEYIPSDIFSANPQNIPHDYVWISEQMGYGCEAEMWDDLHTKKGLSPYKIKDLLRARCHNGISDIAVRKRLIKIGIYVKYDPKGKKLPRGKK
jgi:hypothetical protein